MQITVKLIATLGEGRPRVQVLSYLQGTRVGQVIADLELPVGHFGIAVLNGHYTDMATILSDGDVLSLLPLVDGG